MAPAYPSRDPPSASTDLEAGLHLRLGEYADCNTLSASEARLILQKTLEQRRQPNPNGSNPSAGQQNGGLPNTNAPDNPAFALDHTEVTSKTLVYLELFAAFKNVAEAQQVEGIVNSYGKNLEKFEKSQLGTLVPGSSDEAKALIPSLEEKVGRGVVSDQDLDEMCRDLKRLERQAQL